MLYCHLLLASSLAIPSLPPRLTLIVLRTLGVRFMLLTIQSVFVGETFVSAVSKVINLGPKPVGVIFSSRSVVDIKLTVPR
jgi:hypothetical protein